MPEKINGDTKRRKLIADCNQENINVMPKNLFIGAGEMLLTVLIANTVGNILVESTDLVVAAEERLHWRTYLTKLGADNLRRTRNEELFVACHKSVYAVYTLLGDVQIYVVGKEPYDELALAEVVFVITVLIRDACKKAPSERSFIDNYGKICLCLDEVIWKGLVENTDEDRIKMLIRLKPPTLL